jgi:uncharacterized protein YuzE
MAKTMMTPMIIDEVFKATSHLLKLPAKRMWIDYDTDADVLYISMRKPQKATDSEMEKNGILFRYRGKELVGITILDASTRHFED